MGRLLKHLIPDDTKDSLNKIPAMKWLALGLMLLVGIALVFAGVGGIRTKRLTGKGGRVYEGSTAQLLGLVYVVLGAGMSGFVLMAMLGIV